MELRFCFFFSSIRNRRFRNIYFDYLTRQEVASLWRNQPHFLKCAPLQLCVRSFHFATCQESVFHAVYFFWRVPEASVGHLFGRGDAFALNANAKANRESRTRQTARRRRTVSWWKAPQDLNEDIRLTFVRRRRLCSMFLSVPLRPKEQIIIIRDKTT